MTFLYISSERLPGTLGSSRWTLPFKSQQRSKPQSQPPVLDQFDLREWSSTLVYLIDFSGSTHASCSWRTVASKRHMMRATPRNQLGPRFSDQSGLSLSLQRHLPAT